MGGGPELGRFSSPYLATCTHLEVNVFGRLCRWVSRSQVYHLGVQLPMGGLGAAKQGISSVLGEGFSDRNESRALSQR